MNNYIYLCTTNNKILNMKSILKTCLFAFIMMSISSCAKKYNDQISVLQEELKVADKSLLNYADEISDLSNKLATCKQDLERMKGGSNVSKTAINLKDEQIADLKLQVQDCRNQRDKQVEQVGDLTVLSQSASENIKETLSQLEQKDSYIHLLQNAKTKADSINLALAVNLKSVLAEGVADQDVEIKVDKTVVFINLSDKMLYQSGSYRLTTRADEVLSKIATIIESRPDLEVMVEGYTDNRPIRNSCIDDNWDLSVKRATSVVRRLQTKYNIDPNRLIAAGRGEFNTLASNDTDEGRSINRRTRIIILPKLNQFYDLLNPNNLPD